MGKSYDGFVFGRLTIPCHVYISGAFGIGDVSCSMRASYPNSGPDTSYPYLNEELAGLKATMVEARRKDAEAAGRQNFFDGKMARLEDYAMGMDESEVEPKLRLVFGPSSYFTYVATNKSLDKGMVSNGRGGEMTIRQKYVEDPLMLDDNLANSTGASSSIISVPDGRLVYVERSGKINQYPGLFGDGAAGFMDPSKDSVEGLPNPFHTFRREVSEELGIPCKPEDFILLGAGRASDDLHGEIWGELRTGYSVREILSFPKSHKYETLRVLDVPFEPEEVAKIFREQLTASEWESRMGMWLSPEEFQKVPKWVPAHAVNTIHSLVREYGHDKVMKAFGKEL